MSPDFSRAKKKIRNDEVVDWIIYIAISPRNGETRYRIWPVNALQYTCLEEKTTLLSDHADKVSV